MILRISVVALAVLLSTGGTIVAQPSVERDVASARDVYRQVEQEIAARRLARTDSTVACGPFDAEVTRYVDATGRVRRLTVEGGTDDHAETVDYYYDAAGRLRFAFASRGAVIGTSQEERVWYSPSGAVVRRTRRVTAGPGYPFAEIPTLGDPRGWHHVWCG